MKIINRRRRNTHIEPGKSFQCLLFSSSKLKQGRSFNIYYGGSSSGEIINGIYQDGKTCSYVAKVVMLDPL
ncbi:hypothetical protein [Thermophagus xiamenensis]|jgi:hypothetical protein|uniref:Uncharacterized protein n=1 Tax=Thermophagus xiamenensis TaxID=385682 RepID=A0A1I1YP96_9BACT|nr:hypothetical protein [Thermophagus xiamenensis]SFE21249.1 hypothetical protein SAMN05444380_10866 [Thermophagus xiamenensis]